MMHAIFETGYSEDFASVLECRECPVPRLKSTATHGLLVKVKSVAFNPVDYKLTMGRLSKLVSRKHPGIIGCDFSGVIVGRGRDVTSSMQVGDSVMGMLMPGDFPHGSYAEYLVCDSRHVVKFHPAPALNLGFAEAAAMPLVCQTVYQSIFENGKLSVDTDDDAAAGDEKKKMKTTKKKKKKKKPTREKTILILGGSTANGLIATQIARRVLNMKEVIVTSRQEALCTEMGATRVIDYSRENWFEVLKGAKIDVIFDCIGGKEAWEHATKDVLGDDGRFVTIVGDETESDFTAFSTLAKTGLSLANRKWWSLLGYHQYIHLIELKPLRGLPQCHDWVVGGLIRPVIDEEFPLQGLTVENVLKLYEKQSSHGAHGKLVINL